MKSIVVESLDGVGFGTKITDAETGQPVVGVRSVELHISHDSLNTATVEVIAPVVRVQAEATFRYAIPQELTKEILVTPSGDKYALVRVEH